MPSRPRKSKVVCYIVQRDQLLVFRHLDQPWDESGLQVPAGTVKAGETAHRAALREAREETGFTRFRVLRHLGRYDYDMAPYRNEIQQRDVFLLALDERTPERWASHEPDPDDGSGRHRFECYWIPLTQGHALSTGQGALLGRVPLPG